MSEKPSLSRNQLLLAGITLALLAIGLTVILVFGNGKSSSGSTTPSKPAAPLMAEENQTISVAAQNLYAYCAGDLIPENELISDAEGVAAVVESKPLAAVEGGQVVQAVASGLASKYSECGLPTAGDTLSAAIP